ncbi:MAG: gamma-glutamyl-gamma-aminobutyrate hydrolase family protein [Candidatus Woesearchaeota archaeon]
MLYIIDNQGEFIRQFEETLLCWGVGFKTYSHSSQIDTDANATGLILSGGPGNPYTPLNLTSDFVALMNFDVPTIGFCLGHEIIAAAYGGRIARLGKLQDKMEKITITRLEDKIFEGLGKEVWLREKHEYCVSRLPPAFEVLGHSSICPYEIIRHKKKYIYGFQSHPEVSGKPGLAIMKNFLKICGIQV